MTNLKNLPIEISESDKVRSLHLETDSIQSSMLIMDPVALTLKYTQVTSLLLLFTWNPKLILILGLGAGSLTKFFYYNCRRTKIHTVEINPRVISVALQMFDLPRETSRHKVIEDDAIRFLKKSGTKPQIIISDIFDGYGIPTQFTSSKYFKLNFNILNEEGIFVINFWGSDKNTPNFINELKVIFNQVISVNSEKPGNIIVFCFKKGFKFPAMKKMQSRLELLELKINFDLKFFYKRMLKTNKKTFESIFCN